MKLTGWAGPHVTERAWDRDGHEFPQRRLMRAQSSAGAKRMGWRFTRLVNGGQDLPDYPQEIGDCTSFGGKHAIEYRMCQEIAAGGEQEAFHPIFPPWLYGVARTVIGKGQINLNGDGAAGIWIAMVVKKYGILAADASGVPQYSASVAKSWGKNGPPKEMFALAQPHTMLGAERLGSYAQVRDALANDEYVTIATQRIPQLGSVVRNGKRWMQLKFDANQGHQWALVGIDDDAVAPGGYAKNSWGPTAHGVPLNGEPDGGAWLAADEIDRACREGEVIAYYSLNGWDSGIPNVVG